MKAQIALLLSHSSLRMPFRRALWLAEFVLLVGARASKGTNDNANQNRDARTSAAKRGLSLARGSSRRRIGSALPQLDY